jgi:hypothetical protein
VKGGIIPLVSKICFQLYTVDERKERACWLAVLRGAWSEVLSMHTSEYCKEKTSDRMCLLSLLFVFICKSAVTLLLFIVVS